MAEVNITLAEADAALRAKRDATTSPAYQRELDARIGELEARALDVLAARGPDAEGTS